MTPKQFSKYLRRDGGACIHCGSVATAVPQHRAGRGMGGSKSLDKPSNVIVLCADLNGRMESDAATAAYAKKYGWKLERWQDPEIEPVWYPLEGQWFYLDDLFERSAVSFAKDTKNVCGND